MAIQKQATPSFEMPDLPDLPANWSLFVEMLRQRRYTSGDVDTCVGVSRKSLMDWVRAGILSQLFHGLGSGEGDERFGKWRLFSIFDIWTLALYKRLRDEGIYIERLRALKEQVDGTESFEGEMIQWWFYQALASWVHRQPFWLDTNMQGSLGHSPVERHNQAIYYARIAITESDASDLYLCLNLIPLMDKAMALSGPLELTVDRGKGLLVVRLEGQALRLETLQKR